MTDVECQGVTLTVCDRSGSFQHRQDRHSLLQNHDMISFYVLLIFHWAEHQRSPGVGPGSKTRDLVGFPFGSGSQSLWSVCTMIRHEHYKIVWMLSCPCLTLKQTSLASNENVISYFGVHIAPFCTAITCRKVKRVIAVQVHYIHIEWFSCDCYSSL